MKVSIVPGSLHVEEFSIVPGSLHVEEFSAIEWTCRSCGSEERREFPEGLGPKPGETASFMCGVCGAAHIHTFSDPFAGKIVTEPPNGRDGR